MLNYVKDKKQKAVPVVLMPSAGSQGHTGAWATTCGVGDREFREGGTNVTLWSVWPGPKESPHKSAQDLTKRREVRMGSQGNSLSTIRRTHGQRRM